MEAVHPAIGGDFLFCGKTCGIKGSFEGINHEALQNSWNTMYKMASAAIFSAVGFSMQRCLAASQARSIASKVKRLNMPCSFGGRAVFFLLKSAR
jgi:hypothetical protein